MKQSLLASLRLCIIGITMGIADLIPGVSGGTMAFLSGIYEELLESIRIVSGKTLKLILQGTFKEAVASVPFRFLVPLFAGILTAIFSLAHMLSWLLDKYPSFVWAFFFGLVLASVFIVLRRIVRWDMTDKIGFLAATVTTYFIVGTVPLETPDNLPFIFLSGAIAISAMILPGISGSFILLLLGKYQYILSAVTDRNFLTLAVFMSGCIVGLALFARFLSWLFSRHHDISIAILAGVMLGSIRKIWPWQGEGLPDVFDSSVFIALLLMAGGAVLVYFLDRMQVVKERTEDIADPTFRAQHATALEKQQRP